MRAFVLTGGGSLGSTHAGMLQALYEREITPDLIVGTSVGAINGAYIASRPQPKQTAEGLGDVWRGLRRANVFPVDFVAGLMGFTGRTEHFVPSRGLRRLLRSQIEFSDLTEASIPLYVVATDARTGEDLLLDRGNAIEAVLASAAIPGIFPPCHGTGGCSSTAVCPITPRSHTLSTWVPTLSTFSPAVPPAGSPSYREGPYPCISTRPAL